jgi:DNA-binding transcriptional LysR family regulator
MLPPGESLESLAAKIIGNEPVVVVADTSHPLCNRSGISIEDLAGESWVMMNRPRSIMDSFSQHVGERGLVELDVSIETDSLEFLKSAIKNSSLLTVLPKGAVYADLQEGRFTALDVKDMPHVKTAFVHRHGVMPPLVSQIVHEVEVTVKFLSN